MKSVCETPYEVDEGQVEAVARLAQRVAEMRRVGRLSKDALLRLNKFFRIKSIYHSNAIEGNQLNVGETRLVVERGLTITGKPLKDQAEARNLSEAINFLEELAVNRTRPISEADVRQIHYLVLKGINDSEAGKYRTQAVEISGSHYKPTAPESIPQEMSSFGAWMQRASIPDTMFPACEAILVASAAHTWFVTVHPFIDGNGRVARLLMNLLLMRYDYPIAIISREDRSRYYDALEYSQASDLTPFVSLLAESLEESLEEYEEAAKEQREAVEWAQSIAGKLDQRQLVRATNQYEVWKNAMELLKSVFKQAIELLDSSATQSRVYFHDFGMIEVEKYLSMKNYGSAKRTWFFRTDFVSGGIAARYLFFFAAPSQVLRGRADVTLCISREDPPGSFHYERLDVLSAPNVPSAVEVGYSAADEAYVIRSRNGMVRQEKIEDFCRHFIHDVIEKHFGG